MNAYFIKYFFVIISGIYILNSKCSCSGKEPTVDVKLTLDKIKLISGANKDYAKHGTNIALRCKNPSNTSEVVVNEFSSTVSDNFYVVISENIKNIKFLILYKEEKKDLEDKTVVNYSVFFKEVEEKFNDVIAGEHKVRFVVRNLFNQDVQNSSIFLLNPELESVFEELIKKNGGNFFKAVNVNDNKVLYDPSAGDSSDLKSGVSTPISNSSIAVVNKNSTNNYRPIFSDEVEKVSITIRIPEKLNKQ